METQIVSTISRVYGTVLVYIDCATDGRWYLFFFIVDELTRFCEINFTRSDSSAQFTTTNK